MTMRHQLTQVRMPLIKLWSCGRLSPSKPEPACLPEVEMPDRYWIKCIRRTTLSP
jgi:hypothetical protein